MLSVNPYESPEGEEPDAHRILDGIAWNMMFIGIGMLLFALSYLGISLLW